MSLARAVASYLSSWEGHSSLAPDSYIRVMDLIELANIDEINSEMNALTQQQLWNESLIDVFHDELLKRINADATFAISVVWRDIDRWLQSPWAVIWLGFEDSYLLTDEKGDLVRVNDPTVSSYTLANASFQDPVAQRLVHLLIDGPVNVTVNVNPSGLEIAAISSQSDSKERVDFQPISAQSIVVPAQIKETPEFNLMKRLYLSMKTGQPVIIDTYSNRLIDQLIDYDEARDIMNDNGDTFEGQLFLTGTGVDDDDEE